ncbi:MAG: hypothetical protein U1F77_01510 [Kiritimatiellia bacterium]
MNSPQGDIVLLGSSGHAAVIADIVAREGRWRLAGVLDPERPRGSVWNGLEVLGGDGDVAALMASRGIVGGIAIGDNALRERVTGRIARRRRGSGFVTAGTPRRPRSPPRFRSARRKRGDGRRGGQFRSVDGGPWVHPQHAQLP